MISREVQQMSVLPILLYTNTTTETDLGYFSFFFSISFLGLNSTEQGEQLATCISQEIRSLSSSVY